MLALPDLQCKPTQPKNTIRRLKLLDDINVNAALTSNANPDQQRLRLRLEKEELSKLARFGPTYGDDQEDKRKAKDSAWEHIFRKGGADEAESCYMSSIMEVEKEAMDSYDGTIVEKLRQTPHVFRRMMVRDGCFFLQLALHILGAGELLHYPRQHPYFGAKIDSTSWIPAMFFAGNQIPNVVIHALMKQDFFQKVIEEGIEKGTWKRPTDDLEKLVLYLTVVEPQLERRKPPPKLAIFRGKPPQSGQPPSDILQALHNLFLGSGDNDPFYSEMREFHDLEAGSDDSNIKIPSAGELYKSGIKLRKGKRGIANIRFKNLGFSAFLYLPPLTIDSHTEHLLTSLAGHELHLNESDRELTAYLRFMRDLARTYKDFKILQNKGIIQVKDKKLKGTMVQMLDNLVTLHKSNFTLNFRQTRRKIKDYGGPPWRLISITLAVLTAVQTIFTVLSYCTPPNK